MDDVVPTRDGLQGVGGAEDPTSDDRHTHGA
jgi:hypothetical protein